MVAVGVKSIAVNNWNGFMYAIFNDDTLKVLTQPTDEPHTLRKK